jgi:gluconolactonase
MRLLRVLSIAAVALLCACAARAAVTPGEPVKLGEGFGAIEGPAWDRNSALYFSGLSDGKIYRWTKQTGVKVRYTLAGGCNGLRFDRKGNLLVCQPRARRILRITPKGERQVVVDRYKGARLNSPNDIWVASNGGIYFTDPRYGKGGDLELEGQYVFYLPPGAKEPVPVIKDLKKPNGIVGTADGKKLFVADPKAKQVYAYTIKSDGTVVDRKIAANTGSDGLAVDHLGNLYVTGKAIEVYSTAAKKIASIDVPRGVSNLTFGGAGGRTLFFTSRAGVFSIPMNVRDGSDPF